MLGRGKSYATVLNEEHKVGVFALIEDVLIVFVTGGGSSNADLDKKAVSINLIRQKYWLHAIAPFKAGAQHSLSPVAAKNCDDADSTFLVVGRSNPDRDGKFFVKGESLDLLAPGKQIGDLEQRAARLVTNRSPLRVKTGPDDPETRLPGYPEQRTSPDRPSWSGLRRLRSRKRVACGGFCTSGINRVAEGPATRRATVQLCNLVTTSISAQGRSKLSSTQPIRFTDGAAYERFMAPWSRSAGSLFLDWLAQGPDLAWVDVGCGNGAFTELILARSAPSSVCAIDPSEAQIEAARQRISARLVEFSIGDAMTLPYEDARFDVGVMALVLFFVPNPNKGAAELARVTRPGGAVASYTWDVLRGGTPTQPLWEELQALGKPLVRPPSSDISRFEMLKALWAELGIRDVETRELVVERKFVNFDDYWLSMVISSPSGIVEKLSDAESMELKRRLRARLPASATGEITVHSWATAIKGRKAV